MHSSVIPWLFWLMTLWKDNIYLGAIPKLNLSREMSSSLCQKIVFSTAHPPQALINQILSDVR